MLAGSTYEQRRNCKETCKLFDSSYWACYRWIGNCDSCGMYDFFAAISGSAVATVSAVGAFMIPEMVEHGYDKKFSAALTAAAGTIGVVIPPSIPFVIYGVVSGTSITDLFTAGFLPGIMMGLALILVCYLVSKKHGYKGKGSRSSLKEIGKFF